MDGLELFRGMDAMRVLRNQRRLEMQALDTHAMSVLIASAEVKASSDRVVSSAASMAKDPTSVPAVRWMSEQLESVGASLERVLAKARKTAASAAIPARFPPSIGRPLSLDRLIVSEAQEADDEADDAEVDAAAPAGAVSKIEFLEQQLEELKALMEAQHQPQVAPAPRGASPAAGSCPGSPLPPSTPVRASAEPSTHHNVLERAGVFVPVGRPSMVDLVAKATATVQLRKVDSATSAAEGTRGRGRRTEGGSQTPSRGGGSGGGLNDLLKSAMNQRFGRVNVAAADLSPMSDMTGMSDEMDDDDEDDEDDAAAGQGAGSARAPREPVVPVLRGLAGSRRASAGRSSASAAPSPAEGTSGQQEQAHDVRARVIARRRRRSSSRLSIADVASSVPDPIPEGSARSSRGPATTPSRDGPGSASAAVPLGGTRPRQPFLSSITRFDKRRLRHESPAPSPVKPRPELGPGAAASSGPAAGQMPARRPPAALLGAIRGRQGKPAAISAAASSGDGRGAAPRTGPPSFAQALKLAAKKAEERRFKAASEPGAALGSSKAANKPDEPRGGKPATLLDAIQGFKKHGLRKASARDAEKAEAKPAPAAAASGGFNLSMLQGVKLRKTGRKLRD